MSFKTIILNLAIVAGGLMVGIVIAETATALFFPQKVLNTSAPGIFFLRHDPLMGWDNKEGAEEIYSPSPTITPTRIRINSQGNRGEYIDSAKPAGMKRIVFLGDSNTFGYAIDEGSRFSNLLSQLLPSGYQTINMGVFGYGTEQEGILLKKRGLQFSPDIVVLGFSAGDLSDNMSSINGGAAKPFCRLEGGRLVLKNIPVPVSSALMTSKSLKSSIKNSLYAHSHIYRLVLSKVRAANRYMTDSVMEMGEQEGMNITTSIIREIDTVCRENGSRLVVLLISHGIWIDAYKKSNSPTIGYYPAVKSKLTAMNIPFIDTTADFIAYKGKEETYFKNDPVHLTAKGNEIVAKTLYEGLIKHGLVTPGKY